MVSKYKRSGNISRPVDLEFAAWQPSWPRAESQHSQASTEDVHFYEILMTKRTERIFLSMRYINLHFTYLLLAEAIRAHLC